MIRWVGSLPSPCCLSSCSALDGIGHFLVVVWDRAEKEEVIMAEKRRECPSEEKGWVLRRHVVGEFPVSHLFAEYGLQMKRLAWLMSLGI